MTSVRQGRARRASLGAPASRPTLTAHARAGRGWSRHMHTARLHYPRGAALRAHSRTQAAPQPRARTPPAPSPLEHGHGNEQGRAGPPSRASVRGPRAHLQYGQVCARLSARPWAGQGRAGRGRAGRGRAGRGRTGQDRAEQGRVVTRAPEAPSFLAWPGLEGDACRVLNARVLAGQGRAGQGWARTLSQARGRASKGGQGRLGQGTTHAHTRTLHTRRRRPWPEAGTRTLHDCITRGV